jgi:hypothetical protein
VDFYGARQTGTYLAMGLARQVGASVDRAATHELAVIDTATASLTRLPTVQEGWTTTAIAGAGGWLFTRERHREDPQACADADCWSWALYAYHLPDLQPRLLSRSTRPESQTHAPEPRADQCRFAWLEGTGPDADLVVKHWTPGDRSPAVLARVAAATASPYLSLSGGAVWLDRRSSEEDAPTLRKVPLDGGPERAIPFPRLVHYPVVWGDRVAYAAYGPSGGASGAFHERQVEVARIDDNQPALTVPRVVTAAPDVWDLAWLTPTHLVVAGANGVEILDVQATRPIARITTELATAARPGDGHVVVVTSDPAGRDVIHSLRPRLAR